MKTAQQMPLSPPLGLPPLLVWYHAHKRVMPWRDHPDPYAVWVSEIMLQQTQVDTVRPYFERFMARFPDVAALAAAPEADLLKAWEGLGYYTRAHNLQKAARIITGAWQSLLPQMPEALLALPGIGPYTAAAIASICFGVAAPVVDGNVIRVFSRVLAWTDNFKTPAAANKLRAWLTPHIEAAPVPGDFNQALMELGALVCTPRNPACEACPLTEFCIAKHNGTQLAFPVAPPKKTIPTRHTVALLLTLPRGDIVLTQRPSGGLLSGLWELPNAETKKVPTRTDALALLETLGFSHDIPLTRGAEVTHVFSHFKQVLRVFCGNVETLPRGALKRNLHRVADVTALPLTTATRRVLDAHANADA